MAAGLGALRLSPQAFWSMTPRELSAALRALHGHALPTMPPSRAELVAMMTTFPDVGRAEAQRSPT